MSIVHFISPMWPLILWYPCDHFSLYDHFMIPLLQLLILWSPHSHCSPVMILWHLCDHYSFYDFPHGCCSSWQPCWLCLFYDPLVTTTHFRTSFVAVGLWLLTLWSLLILWYYHGHCPCSCSKCEFFLVRIFWRQHHVKNIITFSDEHLLYPVE